MIIKILNHEMRFYFSKLEKRVGVCSQVFEEIDRHMLLWDFDDGNLNSIVATLDDLQRKYDLPKIYIIQSSKDKYHAYCFCSRPFMAIIHILSDTVGIDVDYFRMGIVRGFFTLRITPRENEATFRLVKTLYSIYPDEITPLDITTNEYFTSNRGQFNNE